MAGQNYRDPIPLPDHFTKLGCCAIGFNGIKGSECIGCSGYMNMCCCESDGICCKPVSKDSGLQECCVMMKGVTKCGEFGIYRCYQQIFCCECVGDLFCCKLDEIYGRAPLGGVSKLAAQGPNGKPPLDTLRIWSALCCATYSYFCKFPDCCGCSSDSICCCVRCENSACLCCTESRIIQKQTFLCVPIKTCCKSQVQCCCHDTRQYFPCDAESPCVFTFLGFTMCIGGFNWTPGCCISVQDAVNTAASKRVNVA